MTKIRARHEKFLAEMKRIVPMTKLFGVNGSLYLRSGRVGRQRRGAPKMPRICSPRRQYALANEAQEGALNDGP